MKDWSVKKIITWGLLILFVIGSILAGGPFNFIDIIIVRPIVNIQFMIFNLVHDFGIAIVVFAVLVKLCMWPLTKRQLQQTRLMRKIQPELTQIRKNCNGNKQMESLQTMDLYKRYNVKPFASILVLLIQLPIFIAVFSAIRVIATPLPTDNLTNRAYEIVAYEGSEIKTLEDEQINYLEVKYGDNSTEEEKEAAEYNFHPSLFGVIDLTARASDVINPSRFSWSAVFMLVIAIMASVAQYFATKMQMPSGKSEKSKKFRDLIREAKEGKEIDDAEISNMTTGQMGKMMPIMMFVIMINLHGALAFYYFLSNILTILQQRVIYAKARDDMDDNTDRAILRELKRTEGGKKMRGKIKEAEVVENKKTGTKITRVHASDIKKKRR
ncbi:YidC/Oxa1 family membrane protein insertase [Candidatus Saccharibacteria bacterium]|nr:YidC/Oxa1 family membrane protein insertase [Candidatus Saccharibacteria bacterium]